MSGGIVQLVATGAQDAWLTGKPEVSFFRSNYKRYTQYAHSVERQVIQGTPQAGGVSLVRFEKKGDLLSYVYFTARDSNNAAVPNLDWSKVIDKIELLIGGQVIDTQDFQWMTDVEPVVGAQNFSQRYLNFNTSGVTNQKNSFFPLKFFFCKDYFLALPLVAIQFHDVELRISWSSQLNSTLTFGPTVAPSLPSVPAASLNVNALALVSTFNVANIVTQTTVFSSGSLGSLFPGQLVANVLVPDGNVCAVIQNITSNTVGVANVVIAFSNSATLNSNIVFPAGSILNVYSPTVTATVVGATVGTSSALLTINKVAAPLGVASITPGQYVAIHSLPQPAVVSNVTATTVGITYPTTPGVAAAATLVGSQVSFFPGATVTSSTYSGLTFVCWANFVYLDQAERKFFADNTHDMLIHQVQRVPIGSNPVQELALAHPVKFIAFQSQDYTTVAQGGNAAVSAANYMLKTQLNGVDVGEFRHLPAWVDAPHYYNTPFGYNHASKTANVAIISYCLDTSKNQPTGTINFSRLDTYRILTPVTLVDSLGRTGPLALTNPNITNPYLYAVNYNVLRIQNGMGSLLYAN
jgi:hypothetical protein